MAEMRWRWAVAANITQFHTDEAGNRYRGTKPFTAGTKVLKLMYFDEAHEGMRWWKNTPQDRAEAQAFVQGWQGSKEQ